MTAARAAVAAADLPLPRKAPTGVRPLGVGGGRGTVADAANEPTKKRQNMKKATQHDYSGIRADGREPYAEDLSELDDRDDRCTLSDLDDRDDRDDLEARDRERLDCPEEDGPACVSCFGAEGQVDLAYLPPAILSSEDGWKPEPYLLCLHCAGEHLEEFLDRMFAACVRVADYPERYGGWEAFDEACHLKKRIFAPERPQTRIERPQTRIVVRDPTAQELRSMPYNDYLQTHHWQHMRFIMHRLADGRCQVCNAADRPLNTHHRTYERRGMELPEDLIVLCQPCHALFHENGSLAKAPS